MNSSRPIRVLIAADDDCRHHKLRSWLDTTPDVSIVGRTTQASELSEAVRRFRPHVVVADAQLLHEEPPAYRERLMVRVGKRLVAVNVEDIDIILASGAYADISAKGRRYTMRASLRTLEAELDPERFVRVHRSVIVPIDRIEWFRRLGNGDGEVQTVTGQRAPVSRARRPALERKLGVK
ncbi:MAG TPA: LytTR family DNA-binding domain-containing protein [Gemmatimonadaceae bacterium]